MSQSQITGSFTEVRNFSTNKINAKLWPIIVEKGTDEINISTAHNRVFKLYRNGTWQFIVPKNQNATDLLKIYFNDICTYFDAL